MAAMGIDLRASAAGTVDLSRVSDHLAHQLAAATLNAVRRTQRENPALWARIEARAAELRREREMREQARDAEEASV